MSTKKELTQEQKIQVKDAIQQILSLNRQKEMINNDVNGMYFLLKNLGYPKNLVNQVLKNKQKTHFQLESEKIIVSELEMIIGEV